MYTGNVVQAWFEEHNRGLNVSISLDHPVDGNMLDILQITGSAAQICCRSGPTQIEAGRHNANLHQCKQRTDRDFFLYNWKE